MKKVLVVLLSTAIIMAALSGCVPAQYTKGVEISRDFPDKILEIYDEAIVFFCEEDDDEITLKAGSKDDIEDVVDFYKDLFEDEEDIVLTDEDDDKDDEYQAEGYIEKEKVSFEIDIDAPRGETEKKLFESQFEITVTALSDEDLAELMGQAQTTPAESVSAEEPVEETTAENAASSSNISAGDYDEGWDTSWIEVLHYYSTVETIFSYYSDTLDETILYDYNVYLNGELHESSYFGSFYLDDNLFTQAPVDIRIDVLDNGKVMESATLYRFMIFDATANPTLEGIESAAAEASALFVFGDSEVPMYISKLSSLTNLSYLDLGNCYGVKDISALKPLTGLKYLSLFAFTEIDNITALKDLTRLETLNLGSCYNLDDISPLQNMVNMKKIYLGGLDLKSIAALEKMSQLEYLDMWGCYYLENVKPLAGKTKLEYLDLGGCSMLKSIGELNSLTNLKELELSYCEGISDLSPLGSLTLLEDLDLSDMERLTSLSGLGGLTGLTNLDVGWCENLADISAIANFTNLTYLDISNCPKITDISALKNLNKLEYLYMSDCPGITDLSPLNDLTDVYIDR